MILSDVATWYRRVLSGDELVGSYRSRSSVVCLGAGLIATLGGVKKTYKNDSRYFTNLLHKFFFTFITPLYMFRALLCSYSGGQIVVVQHLVSSLCRWSSGAQVERVLS